MLSVNFEKRGDRKFLKNYLLNAITMRNFESVKDNNLKALTFQKREQSQMVTIERFNSFIISVEVTY
jgi:hypothetical protein